MSLVTRQLAHVAGSSFDPRILPGLIGWYDASQPAGFGVTVPSDNTLVSQWNDLSGNGRHLTQATGSVQPLYRKASINQFTSQKASGGDVLASTSTFGSPNGATIMYDTGTSYRGGGSIQVTLPTVNGNTAGISMGTYTIGTGAGNLLPNTTYTFSAYGYNPSTNAQTASIGLSVQGTGLATIAGITTSIKDTWTRMSVTFTTLASGSLTMYVLNGSGSPATAGDKFWGDCFQLEFGTTATTWMPPCAYPSIYMADGSRSIVSTAMVATGELSAYVVMQGLSAQAFSGFMQYGNGADSQRVMYFSSSSLYGFHYRVDKGSDGVNQIGSVAGTIFDHTPHVTRSVTSFSQATGRAGIDGNNGTLANLVGTGTTMGGALSLHINGATQAISFGTVLLYSKAHDRATQRRVEGWLAARYGVTLARP